MKNESEKTHDEQTTKWLQEQFASVKFHGESPATTTVTKRPGLNKGSLALAASIVTVSFIASSILTGNSEPVWASEPSKWSTTDEASIRATCGSRLKAGLGELEFSGSASPSEKATKPIGNVSPSTPTELPATTVIDRRNTGALGVFEDKNWRVVCLVKLEGTTWKDQGLTVSGVTENQDLSITSRGQITWANGVSVTFLTGTIPEGKTCVNFKQSSGNKVVASCQGGKYALWYPENVDLTPTSEKFF